MTRGEKQISFKNVALCVGVSICIPLFDGLFFFKGVMNHTCRISPTVHREVKKEGSTFIKLNPRLVF